ncbi:MAG: alpha/beta fold hydrolase [Bacillus sp. (in: firmicutes)]
MPMLDVEGCSLHYTVKGEGIPIVFIHPPLLTSANFMYQLQGLSEKYKVITFDIRGHGKSGYSKLPITYSLIVEDLTRILDCLGIKKAYICGYSTGGSIALEFLLAKAGRALGGIVASGMPQVKDLYLKQRISFAARLAKPRIIPLLSLAITWGNSNTSQTFRALYKDASTGDSRNIEQYYRYSLHYNCTRLLSDIGLPVLLVYGSKDTSFHKYAHILHDELPNSELVFLKKVKHQLPTKAAAALNERIDAFIQTHHGQ